VGEKHLLLERAILLYATRECTCTIAKGKEGRALLLKEGFSYFLLFEGGPNLFIL